MRRNNFNFIFIIILTFGFFSGFYIIENKTTPQIQDNAHEPFIGNLKTSSYTWSHASVISDNVNGIINWNIGSSNQPSIANDSYDNLHVVWEDQTDLEGCDVDYDIFYANYNTTTGKWSNTTVISDNVNGIINWNIYTSNNPSIVVDGFNNLHVVWQDKTNLTGCSTDSDIFYTNYSSASGKWSHARVISDNDINWNKGSSKNPSIVVDGFNNLHVVWEDDTNLDGCGGDYDIFYANYSFATGKWSNASVISDNDINWNTDYSANPTIAVDGFNNLHIVWEDGTNLDGCESDPDIFYANYSTTTGKWSNASVISDNVGIKDWNKGESESPSITVDGSDNLHVVWHDDTNFEGCGSDSDIFYANYSFATGKWSNASVISDNVNGTENWNIGSSYTPNIAVDGSNNLHVVWHDATNLEGCGFTDWDIFYTSYSSTIGKWSHASVISDNVNGTKNWNNKFSTFSDIVVDSSDNLHVVWQDLTNLEGCGDLEYDIFYAKRYPSENNNGGIILSDDDESNDDDDDDDEKKDDLNLIILIAFIAIAVITTSFGIYLFKKRSTIKKTTDLNLSKKASPKINKLSQIKSETVEDDILISKEKHFCLVHKGPIEGYNFICECGTYYCLRCLEAIKEIENTCWSCGKVLDPTKPVKKKEVEVKNFDKLDTNGVSKKIKLNKKEKNHKN